MRKWKLAFSLLIGIAVGFILSFVACRLVILEPFGQIIISQAIQEDLVRRDQMLRNIAFYEKILEVKNSNAELRELREIVRDRLGPSKEAVRAIDQALISSCALQGGSPK